MLRLSRARVIEDIEFIINRHNPVMGGRKWTADGVDCVLERHSYLGGPYSFHMDVLHLETAAATRPKWKLMIVSEYWEGAVADTIRATKWLKLIGGKQNDVTAWISRNREVELSEAMGADRQS